MSATTDSINNEPIASGVQALIERLRQEGVDAGRSEAEKLVEEAESRAKWIVSQAQEEADRLLTKARETVEREKTAADEALQVAAGTPSSGSSPSSPSASRAKCDDSSPTR